MLQDELWSYLQDSLEESTRASYLVDNGWNLHGRRLCLLRVSTECCRATERGICRVIEVSDEEQYTKSVSVEADYHGSDAVLEWKSIDSECNALMRP